MAWVAVRDNALWISHIRGDADLAAFLRALQAGDVVPLMVDGVSGDWERMADGTDGRPTYGMKPVSSESRIAWGALQASRGIEVEIHEATSDLPLQDVSAHRGLLAPEVGRREEGAPHERLGRLEHGALVGGRYRIEQAIGQGGMGMVYRCLDERFDRRRAIKVVGASGTAIEEARLRFRREAQLGDLLGDESGFVRVTDWGELSNGAELYLVADLIEGARPLDLCSGSIRSRLFRLAGAMKLVARAHERGIAHRDLKPENILQGLNGSLYLTDFGLAKGLGVPDSQILAPQLTSTGAGFGTPAYMPPEQFQQAKSADERADVFALGVMLYRVLTGEFPFGNAPAEVLRRQARVAERLDPRPRPRLVNGSIPKCLDSLCKWALALDPARRPRDARELESSLERCLTRSQPKVLEDAVKGMPAGSMRMHLSVSHRVQDSDIAAIGQMQSLEELTIEHPSRLTSQGLAHIGALTRLRSLRLGLLKESDPESLAFLARLPCLERLELRAWNLDMDAALGHVAKVGTLEWVSLDMPGASEEGLRGLAGLPALRGLCLSCSGAGLRHLVGMASLEKLSLAAKSDGDLSLLHIAGFPALRELRLTGTVDDSGSNLEHLTELTDRGLERLADSQSLEVIRLEGCLVEDGGLKQLATIPRLQELAVTGCDVRSITSAGISHLSNVTRLHRLTLHCTIDSPAARELSNLERLESLDLFGDFPPDADLTPLVGLCELRRISLDSYDRAVTDLTPLAGLSNLQRVSLQNWSVTESSLEALSGLAELSHLSLCGCELSGDELEHLAQATKLTKLAVSPAFGLRISLTEASLHSLAKLPLIRSLFLGDCDPMTDHGALLLGNAKTLCELFVDARSLNDTALEHLASLPLKRLGLLQCGKVTDRGLKKLARIRTLQSLELTGACQITDSGIQAIAELPAIEELVLTGCERASERSYSLLKSLPTLRELEWGRW